jgi:hypothetical protein
MNERHRPKKLQTDFKVASEVHGLRRSDSGERPIALSPENGNRELGTENRELEAEAGLGEA